MIELSVPWQSLLPLLWLVIALCIERIFPLPAYFHPLLALRAIALQLARRVHPDPKRPRSQQRISGLMALLCLLLVSVALPSIFYLLAELKTLFAFCLLWLSLPSQPWLQEAHLIQHALQKSQKHLARNRLQRWVQRDCSNLSIFGIEKASSEQCVQRQLEAWFGVLFWFVVLGPLAALLYRCCFELKHAWPVKIPYWRDFGAPSQALFQLVNWPPYSVLLILLTVYGLFCKKNSIKAVKKAFSLPYLPQQETQLYASLAHVFPLELGGPIRYRGLFIAEPRFHHPQAPQTNRIQHCIKQLNKLQIVLLFIALAIYAYRIL